jgi:hypothetical protein
MGVKGHVEWPRLCPGASGLSLGKLHQLEPDRAYTSVSQTNLPGDTIGYINFAAFLIRATVINTYYFKLVVARIDHADDGSERKRRMSRSQGFGVELLPVGGLAAVKVLAIPAGVADPSLDGLDRLVGAGDQGGVDRSGRQKHNRHPKKAGPEESQRALHSVSFMQHHTEKCNNLGHRCQSNFGTKLFFKSFKLIDLL